MRTQFWNSIRPRPLRGFQFRLRSMFLAITLVAVGFGLLGLIGPGWFTVVLWFCLLGIGHVAANARGNRLRSQGPDTAHDDPEPWNLPRRSPAPARAAPQTPLGRRQAISLGPFVGAGLGSLVCGCLVVVLFTLLYWPAVPWAAIAFGGISAAVLGAFLGFFAASLIEVAGGAYREASHEHRRTSRPR